MTYTLTLCEPDGRLIATLGEAPALPRFLHVTADQALMSDEAEAPMSAEHTTTYARIASSVWTESPDGTDRDALFVRVTG